MPRKITTRWTAAGANGSCNKNNVCPGVHDLEGRPDVHYVIGARAATLAEVTAWLDVTGGELGFTQVVVAVPPEMSADGFMAIQPVISGEDYDALRHLMGPGEVLGMIPAGSWKLVTA